MPFSDKQLDILMFPVLKNAQGEEYDALIADGSVRSGKSTAMTISFITDAMERFNGRWFGICGKTVGSTDKNIVQPFLQSGVASLCGYNIKYRKSENLLLVSKGMISNTFEIFGGRDESSYQLIQGRTLAGVMFDEVALQPRSFVEQALARCSVDGSKFWFNCNPEGQLHWFNQDWILNADKRNALHLHFTLDDNPSLSEKIKERYRNSYSGVFYQRYILGLWVMAEGIIYDMFDTGVHVLDNADTEGEWYISSDFGIQNATTFLLWRKMKGEGSRWICLDEWYYSGRESKVQKTVTELVKGMETIIPDGVKPKQVIVDPSAAALITELRKNGYHVRAANNDVLDGISDVATLLRQDRLFISNRCKHTIQEFGVYSWDAKAADRGEDKPIKDNDHCMDALRYFVKTLSLVRKTQEKYISVFG